MMRRGIGRVGRPGLVGTMARTAVVAGTATAVAGGMSRRQQGKAQQAADAEAYEQQQQQAQIDAQVAAAVAAQTPPPAAPAPTAASEDDTITQLTKLAELKAQGILTEEEFAAQKAKVLGG
jgi:Short C-terminal domain